MCNNCTIIVCIDVVASIYNTDGVGIKSLSTWSEQTNYSIKSGVKLLTMLICRVEMICEMDGNCIDLFLLI